MSVRAKVAVVVWLAAPATAWGCEPILPLARAMGGPAWMGESVLWLAAAVIIKCVVFMRLERRLTWTQAVGFLVAGNVLSTLVGVLVAVAASGIAAFCIGLPLIYALSVSPAGRLVGISGREPVRGFNPMFVALAAPALLVVTWVLFAVAQGFLNAEQLPLYWATKLAYLLIALLVSLGLTTFWEEWVVARLAGRAGHPGNFLVPVFRANYVALAVVALGAAVRVMPARLRGEHFLVSLASSLMGLG